MQQKLNRLAIERNIHPSFLEFAGIMDESKTVGKILYLYHIQDEQHPSYKSTIALKIVVS